MEKDYGYIGGTNDIGWPPGTLEYVPIWVPPDNPPPKKWWPR